MKIAGIIWLQKYVEKIISKHNVYPEEVEEIFKGQVKFKRVSKGKKEGEDIFTASGKTMEGRFIIAAFIFKKTKKVLILSARDMTKKEKSNYAKK